MAQYKFPHVEDYIEIIAGYREPNGKNNHSIFSVGTPPISLARYDMKVIPSLAEQSIGGQGYTDKQAALATQLVVKYERQLAKLGVDVGPIKTAPEFRNAIRSIDRSTRAWIEDDVIQLKFPYHHEMIETVRTESKTSKGKINWNPDKKSWVADLTEYNLNWVYAFAKANNFTVDASLETAMCQLLAVESTPYRIELTYKNSELKIDNAATSLIDYVNDKLGGFDPDNLLPLVDNAPILGYTIEKVIEETVIEAYGTRFYSLCANKEVKCNPIANQNIVHDVIDYARATNRFPIYVYEPDLSDRLKTEFTKYFPDSLITVTNNLQSIPEDIKIVYTTKIPRTPLAGRIPLLLTSSGMLFGGDRQVWLQNAEKVVYFSTDVYNKNKERGKNVCKLN